MASTTTTPPDWPAVKLYMLDPGFTREWTAEDAYTDSGDLLIQLWGTSRQQLKDVSVGLAGKIEALPASISGWTTVMILQNVQQAQNPIYTIQTLLERWYSGQEEGVRTIATVNGVKISAMLYRCDMHYHADLHGAVAAKVRPALPAEDRATLASDPSADSGATTEWGGTMPPS